MPEIARCDHDASSSFVKCVVGVARERSVCLVDLVVTDVFVSSLFSMMMMVWLVSNMMVWGSFAVAKRRTDTRTGLKET